MAFHVDKVYYMPQHDLLVLAGRADPTVPTPKDAIDLPRSIQGPGWVPIRDVQVVPFEDGTERLCVVLDYDVVVPAPLMEFKDLEGLDLDVRPAES